MSSTAQINANQQNAKLSTGPLSPEGKAVSSRNAVTHGLCAGFAVLPHEDREAYEHLLSSYRETFQPRNEHEFFLVKRMVESRWKLDRLQRMETALIKQMTGQELNLDADAVIVTAMLAGNGNAYASLQRYTAAAERSYYQAKRELERERAAAAKPAALSARPVQNEPKSAVNLASRIAEFIGNPLATLDDLRKIALDHAAESRRERESGIAGGSGTKQAA